MSDYNFVAFMETIKKRERLHPSQRPSSDVQPEVKLTTNIYIPE